MPQVPTYDDFQVAAQDAPNARFDRLSSDISPATAAIGANQTVQMGNAMQSAGSDLNTVFANQQQLANQVPLNDSKNQALELKDRLTYDPNQGYTQVKGLSAVKPDNGQPLAVTYAQKLSDGLNQIRDGLWNDAQRQQFDLFARNLTAQFYGEVTQHEGQEFHNYNLSVNNGTVAISRDAIGKNYKNPDAIEQNIQAIHAATYQNAQLLGHSASEADALAQKEASGGLLVAIGAALQDNNPTYAQQLIKQFGSNMTSDDLVRATGIVGRDVSQQLGMSVAHDIVKEATNPATNGPSASLANAVAHVESGGKETDANGNVLTSSKGAKGSMQVLDSTAQNPGFGVTPAKDNSPQERARVGVDLLNKWVARYGDIQKGVAAYNAGPGNVDKAIQAAQAAGNPGNWMQYLPKPQETIPYVQKVMAQYTASSNKGTVIPTAKELDDRVLSDPRLANNPAALEIARSEVAHQQQLMLQDQQQHRQDTKGQVQQAIVANGGNFNALPSSLRNSLNPADVPAMQAFASQIASGQRPQTDWSLYYKLKDDPTLLTSTNLMAFRSRLGDTEFKELTNSQSNLRNVSGGTDEVNRLRTGKEVINQYMSQAGINPNPKPGDKDGAALVGRVWSAFEQRVQTKAQALNRKLSPDEINKEAASLFTPETVRGWLWDSQKPAIEVNPNETVVVPPADRQQIISALQAAKRPVTEGTIQNLYRQHRSMVPYGKNK